MNLIKTANLSDCQKNDILVLELACRKNDGIQGSIPISNSINFNGEIDCFYLLYDGKILVSFLAMFIPTPQEAEISALTLPLYRRKGHFKYLLSQAKRELKKYSINDILFVHEPICKNAKTVLGKLGAKYEYSEYLLVYNGRCVKDEISKNPPLQLKEYTQENFEDIASLCAETFKEDYQTSYAMVEKSLQSKDITVFGAYLYSQLIGVCNVNFECEDVSIFGFGILPLYQRKGYGKLMLRLLIDELLNKENIKSITLEVNGANENAFCLYKKCGFDVKAQFDYYRMGI